MFKQFLRKILPPPAESISRHVDKLMDAFEDQQNLTYMLMQQTQALSRKVSALQGEELPANACLAKKPLARLQFSVSLAYHCNLNCKGCAHFSPLSPAQFPDFEEVERDFARLSELFAGKCKYVCLMGGEPLMNPRIEDYCRMARKYFPIGDVQIVTNGILLQKMPDSFYETCREEKISIHLTPYPIKLDHKAIRRRCKKHKVEFHHYWDEVSKDEFFRYVIDETGSQDMVENFTACHDANNCLFLYKGRMYPCGSGTHFRIFNEHFQAGMELTDADSVDIYQVGTAWELLLAMARPVPMCRYCVMSGRKEFYTWGHSKKDKQEWI
jgi:organic radical activating enzyme